MDTITFNPDLSVDGTSFRLMLHNYYTFEAAVARLYQLAGYNIFEKTDGEKSSFGITGQFNGKIFTLYDYKGDRRIHIGGYPDLDADIYSLQKLLLEMMANITPKNFEATSPYTGETYSWPVK